GSKRTHYRHRRGWVWGGRTHHRPRGDATHSKRWCLEHIRLPGHRLSHRDNNFRLLYAESARRLEAGGLVADSEGDIGTCRARLRLERGTQDLAVVGALAAVVSQYLRRHFGYLAGGTDFSGTNEGKRSRGGWHGGNRQPWKRRRPSLLGMGFRLTHETGNIFCHVPPPGSTLLVSSERCLGLSDDDRHFRRVD